MLLSSIIVISTSLGLISTASLHDPDLQHEGSYNAINDQQQSNDDPIKEIMSNECQDNYSPFCLKLTVMNMIGSHRGITALQILPGITITSTPLPASQASWQRIMKEPSIVDTLLLERISDYLGSLSLNLKFLNRGGDATEGNSISTARGKKNGGAIIAAGLLSAGTVLAISLAGLAAISGKALMAALMALLLAGIAALNKGQDDHKTTYEIVAKPVVSQAHTHTSEVQHGHHHGHYKRSIDAHAMAYSQQVPS